MVTSVIGYYFTLLNVTDFSSFWFLGGSDTGLAVLSIYSYLYKLLYINYPITVNHTLIQYPTRSSTTIYSTPLTAIFSRLHTTQHRGSH